MPATDNDYYDWQHAYWADNAAEWEKWAEIVAPQAEGFNRPLIDAAGIGAGGRVLDLACGAGEPALTAAAAVGAGGHVTASDYSPEMLAVAERRARTKGLGNMSFRQADMRALPFDDGAFDHVISRFGFMYTEEPETTASEILRVLLPGGRVALMVWGPMADNTVLSVALDAANAQLNVLDEAAAAHPAVFAAAGSMSSIFEAAGFADAAEKDLTFAPSIPVGVAFWQPIVGMNMGAAMRGLDNAALQALDAKVAEAYAPYIEDGKYRLAAHIRVLSGRKPG